MGRAKSKAIARAEEEAQRVFAAARARVGAQGLEDLAQKASAEAAETARIRAELESDLAQAYREGRVAEWPRWAELRAATARDDAFVAVSEAATERLINETNKAGFALRRVLILKAAAADESRAAHGRGGKRAARTKAKEAPDLRRLVEGAARRGSKKAQAARDLKCSRNTVAKYWPQE